MEERNKVVEKDFKYTKTREDRKWDEKTVQAGMSSNEPLSWAFIEKKSYKLPAELGRLKSGEKCEGLQIEN